MYQKEFQNIKYRFYKVIQTQKIIVKIKPWYFVKSNLPQPTYSFYLYFPVLHYKLMIEQEKFW